MRRLTQLFQGRASPNRCSPERHNEQLEADKDKEGKRLRWIVLRLLTCSRVSLYRDTIRHPIWPTCLQMDERSEKGGRRYSARSRRSLLPIYCFLKGSGGNENRAMRRRSTSRGW